MRVTHHAAALSLLLALVAPAFAEDGCGKFAWPLTRERVLFAATDKTNMQTGEALSQFPSRAVVLQLQPKNEAIFALPPERRSTEENWYGGIVRLPAPEKAGIYQITLSDDAWIDVVQDGRYTRSVGSTGRRDCPGLRKSVRLDLAAAPFILQISGVASDRIAVVIGGRD